MYDTVIVGAGIAGLTAAIYASRKRMNYAILSSNFGGQLMICGEILNYPGFTKTDGLDFIRKLEEQVKFNDIDVKLDEVESIEKSGINFLVKAKKGDYETQSVILATGARPRKLGIPGEDEYTKKGLTYCSICDGPLFSGKDVAIIGGGDAALEAVDFMKDIAEKIYLVNILDRFTAHEYLQEKIKNNPKVEVLYNTETKKVSGGDFVESLELEQGGKPRTLDVEAVIVEIGRLPNTEPFKDFVKLDEHNHIEINCRSETDVAGVYAAGDCTGGHEYQYVIAAGQGCMALIKAARYLANKKGE